MGVGTKTGYPAIFASNFVINSMAHRVH